LQELEEGQMERRMLNGLSLCLVERERWGDAKEVCERLLSVTEREDNMALVRTRMEEIEAILRKEEEEEGEEEGEKGGEGGDGEEEEEGEEGWEEAQEG